MTMFRVDMEAMLPNAHVHIFSTTFDHFSKTTTYNGSQFDIYKSHGFQVHLDCRHLLQHYLVLDLSQFKPDKFSTVFDEHDEVFQKVVLRKLFITNLALDYFSYYQNFKFSVITIGIGKCFYILWQSNPRICV